MAIFTTYLPINKYKNRSADRHRENLIERSKFREISGESRYEINMVEYEHDIPTRFALGNYFPSSWISSPSIWQLALTQGINIPCPFSFNLCKTTIVKCGHMELFRLTNILRRFMPILRSFRLHFRLTELKLVWAHWQIHLYQQMYCKICLFLLELICNLPLKVVSTIPIVCKYK